MGMRSPTFQPKRWAVRAPTTAPWRSFKKVFHWSSGTMNSGYTWRCFSTSITIWCEMQGVVSALRNHLGVRHHQHRLAGFADELINQNHNFIRALAVQVAGRFVAE